MGYYSFHFVHCRNWLAHRVSVLVIEKKYALDGIYYYPEMCICQPFRVFIFFFVDTHCMCTDQWVFHWKVMLSSINHVFTLGISSGCTHFHSHAHLLCCYCRSIVLALPLSRFTRNVCTNHNTCIAAPLSVCEWVLTYPCIHNTYHDICFSPYLSFPFCFSARCSVALSSVQFSSVLFVSLMNSRQCALWNLGQWMTSFRPI